MLHALHYSRMIAHRLAFAGMLACLAGCGTMPNLNPQGPFGRILDRPPPPVVITRGGPTGVLINGPAPVVTDIAAPTVDQVVGDKLRLWLTPEERRALALASEHAVIATTDAAVAWRALDGAKATTAHGTVMPVDDVFRSLRGEICRDVRQRAEKDNEAHAETVTLCRQDVPGNGTLWLIGSAD